MRNKRIIGPLPRDPNEPSYFHTMGKAVEGQIIFARPEDVKKYEEFLALAAGKSGAQIIGYCANYNHHHELLKSTLKQMEKFMYWLQFRMAETANMREDREGIYFFRPYSAYTKGPLIVIQKTLAYVNINPFKDGAVASFEDPSLGAHRAYLGLEPAPKFLDVDAGLALFYPDPAKAREKYKETATYVAQSLSRLSNRFEEALLQFQHKKAGQVLDRERLRYLVLAADQAILRARSMSCRIPFDERVIAGHILEQEEGLSHRDSGILLQIGRQTLDRGIRELRRFLSQNPSHAKALSKRAVNS